MTPPADPTPGDRVFYSLDRICEAARVTLFLPVDALILLDRMATRYPHGKGARSAVVVDALAQLAALRLKDPPP